MKLSQRLVLIGLLATLALSLTLQALGVAERLDKIVLDHQFAVLRQYFPRPLAQDVVVVGIDEAALAHYREPFSLWHPHLSKFLQAMSLAQPRVVGLDVVLPDRSYYFLGPRYDQSLLEGLLQLKSVSPVVLARAFDESGKRRKIFPPYMTAAGGGVMASIMVCRDSDDVIRRLDLSLCSEHAEPPLAQRMAEAMGMSKIHPGYINFAIGEKFSYIPFLTVVSMLESGDIVRLKKLLGNKPVLLGVILPFDDRLPLPVPLAAWEPYRHYMPGVLLHAQALRSMMHQGLIQTTAIGWSLLLAGVAAFFWLGRSRLKVVGLILFIGLVWLLSIWLLWQGYYFPVGGIMLTAILAWAARVGYTALCDAREKRFLRRAFSGYVSPQILEEILSGKLQAELGGTRRTICVLFSDIRDFTARSEQAAPEDVIDLLNSYFTSMSDVIHRHGGTIDKFMGDGIMAFFGAPQALSCPEQNAWQAAMEMFTSLDKLNLSLQSKHIPAIKIGIGLHSGVAVVGHVGSQTRHNYTAVGDAVNLAARLESLSKEMGYALICSANAARAIQLSNDISDLGRHAIKGHTDVHIFGWNPPATRV